MEDAVNVLSSPPSPILSDYMELASLALLFAAGGPLNLVAWAQLAERRRRRQGSQSMEQLKRQLNYSDLLVMFIYVPGRAFWLITYDWRAGSVFCKVFKFCHAFGLQLSSNVVVCIAIDRLLALLLPVGPT